MTLVDRIIRYDQIEQFRNRPLIVYATSTRGGVGAMMAADAVRQFIDQIDAIPAGDSIDILIHSTGGDPLTAWKLMSILRERFKHVGVLVPYMAFSAATIFALGADEIVMHSHASLGPIDPQITITQKDGTQRKFSFEDVGAFLRFLTIEIGLTEQEYVSAVVDKLFSVVDPVHVGGAKRASELSTDVGERLLQMHMTSHEERPRARAIAEGLNKTFFAHGDAVSKSRARGLQLKLAEKDNPELDRLIWNAYLGIEEYMELRTPFKPFEYFLANGGAQSVAPTTPLVLPPNASPQLLQQVWNQVAQNAINSLAQPATEVEYSLIVALIESSRKASEYWMQGALTAARVGGGEVQVVRTDKESGWRDVEIPPRKFPPDGKGKANTT
jgi:hypothetical protein